MNPSHEPFPGSADVSSARARLAKLADEGVRAPVCCRIMVREQVRKEQEALHEPGRADLPVGLDAQQRVPTWFMVPMRAKFRNGGGFP